MPVPFPTLNPDTGELETLDYYTVDEVAALLHVHANTVRRRINGGEWPHLTIAQGHFLNAEQIAEVIALSTHKPAPDIPCRDGEPPRLGVPLSDKDLEGLR